MKKAENVGVTVELADERGFELFAAMHQEMVARKHAADSDPVELLPSLHRHLLPALRPVTVIARHEGEPVAGAIIAIFGDTAYYLYGASRDRALKLNAGYALHWWIVGWLSTSSAIWYDLGGAPVGSMLRQFKSGLTGKQGRIISQIGERDYWVRADQRIAADALFRLRDAGQTPQRQLARLKGERSQSRAG